VFTRRPNVFADGPNVFARRPNVSERQRRRALRDFFHSSHTPKKIRTGENSA
jgi:hypothetical protein